MKLYDKKHTCLFALDFIAAQTFQLSILTELLLS